MKKIILTADDFGFSDSINRGIIGAFHRGLISSASILMNQPFTGQAVDFWRVSSTLSLGLHVNLTSGRSLWKGQEQTPDIITDTTVSYEAIKQEILTQLFTARQKNLKIDFISCHHNLQDNPTIKKALNDVATEENLPMRHGLGSAFTTDFLCTDFYAQKAVPETITTFCKNMPDNTTAEIVAHVGFVDEYTRQHTSYTQRETDLHQLENLKKSGFYDTIQLITFQNLRKDTQ